jgi:hypothetical protein
MSDDLRADYFRRVEAMRDEALAGFVERRQQRTTIREKIAALLTRKATPKLTVAPKARRISGPTQPVLVDDGPGPTDNVERTSWHSAREQEQMPVQYCFACREPMLPGATVRDTGGVCGPCSRHNQGNPMPPSAA